MDDPAGKTSARTSREEARVPLPKPDKLRTDIKNLSAWATDYKKENSHER
jgi:hypothetical protein